MWSKGTHCYAVQVICGVLVICFLVGSKGGKGKSVKEKSRIRETKHISTDADSSTDTTIGWTKNTQKKIFFEKTDKIIQNQKTQKRLEICQN